ncbi:site-specific recombinase Gcr [Flavobacterium limnosediminis JC2902]|uniref:Site-specific recombinase Gcr n=1 Tax=Flavobacterium limnosediminis JC2902 TaxID=1341181 RepID=V6ST98_9FLAO|nr:site-specific recombinase Gcr [Flavobacterium limnosediminis]ESU29866.1 site-specific recombinase Gcr [Flavobacterium limnosediminis JC2902]
MRLRRYTKPEITIESLFRKHFSDGKYTSKESLHFLVDIVRYFRPEKLNESTVSIEKLLLFLVENPQEKAVFIDHLKDLLSNRKVSRMLSDTGILRDSDFIYEVKKRLFDKILPYQPEKDTLEYVLNQVFYLDSDAIWIGKIADEELLRLIEILNFADIYSSVKELSILSELINAMGLITQRMSGRAMETDVIKMVPEYDSLESPFVALEKEFLRIEDTIRNQNRYFMTSEDLRYKQFLILHKQCEDYVDKAFSNSSKYGISLKVNQSLLRIRQQLNRLKILISLLVVDKEEDKYNNSIRLAQKVIRYNCYKKNVGQLINESTQLLSYEITQHSAKTGEHYITESSKEYFNMFYTAMGGGAVVGILCIIKVLLGKIETSYFGHAFLYSLNYAVGFVSIFLLGFTLATKQPAMTAATLAKALESGMKKQNKKGEKHSSFAHLFVRLFRSQFIAFVGNVIVAFPVALVGIWLIDYAFDNNIAEAKWNTLLTDISLVDSPAIFHAAIAGVFLFLSGIISGSISNRNKHHQLIYRIQEHPLLKKSFGVKKTKRIAQWFENNWAGVVSNAWFGVFMGSTASVGLFLGLDLDIRHITFASGNLALGLYGGHFNVDHQMLFWGIFGIAVIGFVNFMVSFSLSLGLAFRSRNIPLSELHFLNKAIWKYFKKRPMAFFVPVKNKKSA